MLHARISSHGLLGCQRHDVFCFVARSKLKCTSPLGYFFLLVYTSRKKNMSIHLHTHTLLSVCRVRVCVCACISACFDARETAAGGCLDDPSSSSSSPHTNTLLQQVLLVFTPLRTPPTTMMSAARCADRCVFWEIPRITTAYWDRPFC